MCFNLKNMEINIFFIFHDPKYIFKHVSEEAWDQLGVKRDVNGDIQYI